MTSNPAAPPPREAEAYERLQCYTLGHTGPQFIHQHVVDAWAAQHATETTKPISLTFALIGLYLHVEKGYSGRQVQRMHMTLADTRRAWPSFLLPARRGSVTAVEVMAAPAGPARDRAIDAWCTSVWESYANHREAIAELLRECGQYVG